MLAALLSITAAMQVGALAHLFFYISGIIIWYQIPFMRRVPINAARQLGKATRMWKGIPLVYIFVTFFLIPIILLGLSVLFTQQVKGLIVMGAYVNNISIGCNLLWYLLVKFAGGAERVITCMLERQARSDAVESLPDDMISLQAEIARLEHHLGISHQVTMAIKLR